jgi:hypothetical protein
MRPSDPAEHTAPRTTRTRVCGAASCPLGWLGVAAMTAALVVTSVHTATAGAQLPSTSPTPGDESTGGGGWAGTAVFVVVVALIIGTAVTLFVRNRGNQRR